MKKPRKPKQAPSPPSLGLKVGGTHYLWKTEKTPDGTWEPSSPELWKELVKERERTGGPVGQKEALNEETPQAEVDTNTDTNSTVHKDGIGDSLYAQDAAGQRRQLADVKPRIAGLVSQEKWRGR